MNLNTSSPATRMPSRVSAKLELDGISLRHWVQWLVSCHLGIWHMLVPTSAWDLLPQNVYFKNLTQLYTDLELYLWPLFEPKNSNKRK